MSLRKILPSIIILLLLNGTVIGQTQLIAFSSQWRYSDDGQLPPSQGGLAWYQSNYNDSSWKLGNAQLGYGDADEATVINTGILTGYFRHSFYLQDPSQIELLDLDLIFDDGAVVYINGVEVWRVNMPDGPVNYDTFASSSSQNNQNESQIISSTLIAGTNIIAVEVHQKGSTSSDLSFDFQLTGDKIAILRGPYLQKASPTSMVIRWRTSAPTPSVLRYGSSTSNLNQIVSLPDYKTDHEVEITNLNPSTTYYYQIENTSRVLVASTNSLYFKTAPNHGASQNITAWILGDCGTANDDQLAVRDAFYNYMGNNLIDMILFLGDNAYEDGTDEEYQAALFEDRYEDRLQNTVSWSCLGNHDGHAADAEDQTGPYFDIFSFPTSGECGGTASGTEAYYSFNYGNIHFISLDSYDSDRSIGGSMYNWCRTDIQNTTAEWIVAFWHHPPYTRGSYNSDSEEELKEMRENFLPMLENNGVDLVLSGHSHTYERTYFLNGHYGKSSSFNSDIHTIGNTGYGDGRIDGDGAYQKLTNSNQAGKGAVYITNGVAGKTDDGNLNHKAMYYSVSALGSCLLQVNGSEMSVKFIGESGTVEDYFTISKGECTDEDGDGYCIEDDPDDSNSCIPEPDNALCEPCITVSDDDFESGFGEWIDGGSDCTRLTAFANSGDFSIQLKDNSGIGSSIYTENLDFSGYDEAQIEFSFYSVDIEDEEDFMLEVSTDGGSSYSVYQQWIGGTDFENDTRYFESVTVNGLPFTQNTRFRFRCDASGNSDWIYLDDLKVSKCEQYCTDGEPCDDGDPCTAGSTYDTLCNCTGGVFQDNDGDGYCTTTDPDDNDSCNPDPNATTCFTCAVEQSDTFDNGFGNWNDGGGDCARTAENSSSGNFSIRLRDNSGTSSSFYTNDLDYTHFQQAKIDFSYYAEDVETGERFVLEVSVDGGDNYIIYRDWVSGVDFENNTRYFETIYINGISFTGNTVFRFRSDASNNSDEIFFDDVNISGCGASAPSNLSYTEANQNNHKESETGGPPSRRITLDEEAFKIFPNPANGIFFVDLTEAQYEIEGLSIYNMQGIMINHYKLPSNPERIVEINMTDLPSGVYVVYLKRPGKRDLAKKVVLLFD